MQIPPVGPPQAVPCQDATRTAQEFEAVFLTQSFEQAFRTLPDTAFGGGQAGESWRHFLARAIADEVAAGGTTGIAAGLAPLIDGAPQ